MELDQLAGPCRLVSRVVKPSVVVAADQECVVEVGAAAVGPGVVVVGVAPGRRDVTALDLAGGVSCAECFALGWGEESLGSAEVEDLGLRSEDRGDDVGG